MVRFAVDKQLRSKCGEKSVAIAREFDATVCAEKYVKIYQDALNL